MTPNFVFNMASSVPPFATSYDAKKSVVDLLEGLAEIGAVESDSQPVLKISTDPSLICIAHQGELTLDLRTLVASLYSDMNTYDLASYFDAMFLHVPSEEGLEDYVITEILDTRIEEAATGHAGTFHEIVEADIDAVMCAVTGAVLVSTARANRWQFDRSGFVTQATEQFIDHVSCYRHALAFLARSQTRAQSSVTRQNFKDISPVAFPHLYFGVDVPSQLMQVDPKYSSAVFGKLATLETASMNLTPQGLLDSSLGVRGESEQTMRKYGEERRFRDRNGTKRTYTEHLSAGALRIYLRVDRVSNRIEIAYIGRHPSTVTFGT
ncbi:hypothetical protein C7458_103578 [Williamsia muralis]|nr:hypothetical protein C7458_103578 [Williamsia marianensis]